MVYIAIRFVIGIIINSSRKGRDLSKSNKEGASVEIPDRFDEENNSNDFFVWYYRWHNNCLKIQ